MINTKKTILSFALLSIVLMNAQTFVWGNKFQSINESGSKLEHILSKSLYKINSTYNEKTFNRDVMLNSFELSNLNNSKATDLSIKQPVMGLATMTHLEMYQENNTSSIIFLDDFNTKTKERELYFQKVNLETGEKTNPVIVTSMPTRNSTYYIAQSPNKQFYAVIKQHSHDKKANEKLNVAVFDKDLKLVKDISFEIPYLNKNPNEQSLYVNNQGNVFIVKEIDMAKVKPFRTLFFWDTKQSSMAETSLKFDNDYQIFQYKGQFLDNDFYIQGLYTRIGSKAVQVYGGNIPASGIYIAKFNSKGEKIYIEKNETGEIGNLNVKDFVFDGMKTWFFGDKMFVEKKAKPTAPGQNFNFEYNYTYSNKAIVFGKIDNETGKLEWFKDLPFDEPNTTNDNGSFLSYLYVIKNNQLTILYNDTQKTVIAKRTYNDRFTAIETFDDRGNPLSKSLIAETGLELKYIPQYDTVDENFDLDTSVKINVTEGKYIVRAKSPSNEKYGYLTF